MKTWEDWAVFHGCGTGFFCCPFLAVDAMERGSMAGMFFFLILMVGFLLVVGAYERANDENF